jgi:hypothetical protein
MVDQPGRIWALGTVGRDYRQVAETSRFFDDDAVSVRVAWTLVCASELKAAFLAVSLSVAEVPEAAVLRRPSVLDFLQERLRILEVRGIESFGVFGVDRPDQSLGPLGFISDRPQTA